MKFSPSTKGFYLEEIHADAIPSDAVDITEAEHAALLDGQQVGKVITAGADGNPFLADPAPPTPMQIILGQIAELEATVTDRRLREAVLGIDSGWLAALNDQCTALRAKLK